jgi:hypothetical protein
LPSIRRRADALDAIHSEFKSFNFDIHNNFYKLLSIRGWADALDAFHGECNLLDLTHE